VLNKYYLIRSDVLPEVFHKVINVKQLVDREDGLSINEACKRVKISRSAYYKYRDSVRLIQLENGCTVSIILELDNLDNIVFRCVNAVRDSAGRVKSFQVSDSQLGNKYALIIAEMSSDEVAIAELKNKLQQVRGVKKVTILR
jgi:chorismate mutase